MHRNKSVNVHQFAMVPRAEIPRAKFNMQTAHKTTFDAGYLVPVLCEEVLPGDTFNVRMTAFARLATPIFPVMDNLHLDSFFFFVPNRLVWSNWQRFMGEQDQPTDSTSYVVPVIGSPSGGFPVNSLYDYLGLPTTGQIAPGNGITVNALPIRGYALIYNEWFRDENLCPGFTINKGDTTDVSTQYELKRRGKRHDYFTSCLPWPQKGQSVSLPLGTSAPVVTNSQPIQMKQGAGASTVMQIGGVGAPENGIFFMPGGTATDANATFGSQSGLYADLSTATAATINQLRQAFQIQKLLERDARGGTRYTELVHSHFGVISPDARLQRPEYLGGGSSPLTLNPVVQNSGTGAGSDTPLGTLSAVGTVVANRHGFTQSFTEHGYVFGIVSVRADLSYQQGLRRHWSRSTRYDYYFPAFAMLGEQAVLTKEIFMTGNASDSQVFGYQERWAEYRYSPSQVTGLFRSTSAGTLDAWHLSQHFTAVPTLSADFIEEKPPVERILAVGAEANGAQFIFDSFFDIQAARPMPMYSVPGLIDHF